MSALVAEKIQWKAKQTNKMFPPKLFLENSDYLEKWNLQLAKFPNFCCQNIMSYPNYQILFLSTDEIVRKISIITNVNHFFSLRKLFSQSKFPNFCWENNMSYPYYQILSLSNRWNCQKIVYHNSCKQTPIKNIVFAKLRYCPVHSIFTWNFHKEKKSPFCC